MAEIYNGDIELSASIACYILQNYRGKIHPEKLSRRSGGRSSDRGESVWREKGVSFKSDGTGCGSILPWLVVLLLLLSSCATSFEERVIKGGQTVEMAVESTINGLRRDALVHIPSGYNEKSRYPLIVVIHGAFSTAEKMERETGFSELADSEKFIALYPNGIGLMGFLQHWNGGHCCGKAAADDIDDVAFLQECIDKAADVLSIDQSRIYLTGFSNGGMLTYKFAAERSQVPAALAVLGASVGGRVKPEDDFWLPAQPENPLPLMIVHGLADETVPARGGRSISKGGTREYLSLEETTLFWLRANGCQDEHIENSYYSGQVNVKNWQKCMGKSSIQVHTISGWGHSWPGKYHTSGSDQLKNYNISRIIWEFFEKYTVD